MLSVCICTYNRAQSLARTLETLAGQSGIDWAHVEVIVVDNNCADDTAAVVEAAASRLPIRRVVETVQGLSHARNRAIMEARGEWVIFIDDDVVLEPSWLSAYQRGLLDFDDAGFAAGRVVPDWRGMRPRWFQGEQLAFFDGLLVWCEKGANNRYLELNEMGLVGASFAINIRRIDRSMRFRTDLGHQGKTQKLGEETDFVQRLQRNGVRGAYIGMASCRHPVDFNRLTLKGLYVHGLKSGRTYRKMQDAGAVGSITQAGSFFLRGVYQLIRGRGDRFRQCIVNAGFQIGLMDGDAL